MAEPNDNKDIRGPVNLRIKFRSASLQQFIERYGVDVSRGGIFIRTREPLPVGTRLKLDFQLVDAAPLFQGDGTVVWIREYDPGKAGVTPGMGVRFDRLTPESQPTLDKILDEKMRLQQTGVAPGGVATAGAGLAVRRPSGVITALDAKTTPKSPPPPPPPPPPAAVEVKMDAPTVGAAPVTTMPASQSRSGPVPSSGGGIFSRPRTTGSMSTLRSAPVPSHLFEQPTAADIDKALLALEEKGPTPSMPLPPPPPPVSVAPASMGDDEPTKVFDSAAQEFAVHEAITGQTRSLPDSGVPIATNGEDLTAKREMEPSEPVPAVAQSAPGSGRALDAPLAAHLDGTAPVAPPPLMTPAAAAREAAAVPKRIAVDQPGRGIESGRFRSDTKYRRTNRKTSKMVIAVLLAGAAAAGVVLGKREFDKRKAASVAMAPAPAPTETAAPVPPPVPPPAAENAGVAPTPADSTAAAPTEAKTGTPAVAAPDKAPEPAVAMPKPEKAEKRERAAKPAGEKSAEEKPVKSGRRKREAAAEAAAVAAAAPDKTEKPAAPPAGEKTPPAEAAAGTTPAGTAEAPKAAEAAPAEKPLLKVTSSPSGAEVVIDGSTVGTTPFSSKDIDPTAAHAITIRKDGFEAHERMISGSDWTKSRSGAQSLKMNIKLKRTPSEAAPAKDESGGKASDVEILTPSEP